MVGCGDRKLPRGNRVPEGLTRFDAEELTPACHNDVLDCRLTGYPLSAVDVFLSLLRWLAEGIDVVIKNHLLYFSLKYSGWRTLPN